MATELKKRRGTATQHTTFIGALAEVTVNTTNKSLHVHDGVSTNGFELSRADLTNVDNTTFAAKAVAAGVTSGGSGTYTGAPTNASYLTVNADAALVRPV